MSFVALSPSSWSRITDFGIAKDFVSLSTFSNEIENTSVGDYIASQPEVEVANRTSLIDVIIEVHERYKLCDETLNQTFNIIDRFLAAKAIANKKIRLAPVHCSILQENADEFYDDNILNMELRILVRLDWKFYVPTLFMVKAHSRLK
ncbi:G2/mitotic-specific cyclin S13-7-like protein [Tanacetum coccineum]